MKYLRTCTLTALFVTAAFAQTPPPPPLTFEVASIKPAGPLDPAAIQQGRVHVGMKVDGAICDIGAFSLRDLIRTAYEVKDYQITGADSLGTPLEAKRFNIQATVPAGTTAPETSPDTTEAPKKGETVIGQGSNQLRISADKAGGGVTVKSAATGQVHMTMADGRMHLEAAKMSMATLAETATSFVGRPVIDMTELKGDYQVALDLSIDDLKNVARTVGITMPGAGGGNGGQGPAEASDPAGSTIFVSVQQLGLKLEARKAPLPFIVIEHFEKSPTEN